MSDCRRGCSPSDSWFWGQNHDLAQAIAPIADYVRRTLQPRSPNERTFRAGAEYGFA